MMNQFKNEILYNIQQVAEITGLSKQVIRKWEERYGIICPQRLANGYRMYKEQELQILLHMKSLIEQGQTVKQAAMQIHHRDDAETSLNNLHDYVVELLHEGSQSNEANMTRILQQAYHTLGLESFLNEVVVPFLREVGVKWETHQWGEYQESLASLVIRDYLVQVRRNFQVRKDAELILGACLPHERHEIPLQVILLQAMLRGWQTVMLGPSPAPMAIQSTVTQLHPKIVILSAITSLPFENNQLLLNELDQFASTHPDIQFYIGGPGTLQYASQHSLQFLKVVNHTSHIF